MIRNFITGKDGKAISIVEWAEVENPIAILQVAHGMAEHAMRYDKFAKDMNAKGIIVVADDHRAHGKTDELTLGYAKGNIWEDTLSDMAILCAAVADFTPMTVAQQKIKKQPGQTEMTVELKMTTDIAATLGKRKNPGQKLIGFALETHDELANAERKMQAKNLDMIVLNSLQDKGAGFGVDTNKVTLLYADGTKKDLPLLLKQEVADMIIDNLF